MDTAQILKIQEELARRTLAQPTQRHKRLYHLVRDPGGLRAGLDAVLSNPGSHTPGVDGLTKRHIDSRTEGRERLVPQLHEELRSGTYRPPPVKRVYIPKANGKKRPLGIACLRDRAVPATVTMVLEPIYDSVFPPFSWGFRPLRSTHHALSALRRGPADPKVGFKWIIEGDIASCCDEIDHRLLRRTLQKRIPDRPLLDLITRLLRCGLWEDGHVSYSHTGTVQGSVLSPVLARDATCQICQAQPANEVHHDPPWRDRPKHDPTFAMGVCAACHQQTLRDVVKSDGAPRGSKGACGVRASGGG